VTFTHRGKASGLDYTDIAVAGAAQLHQQPLSGDRVMATTKAKSKARAARGSAAKRRTGAVAALNLGKYMDEIKIGNYSWDDVLKSTSKNMDAFAEANRTIFEGYTDIAKRQYAMLKGLLRELRKVRGDRDAVVKELKRVIERAKKDMQALQKIAKRTNSKAQRIVQKRAAANLEAWRLLVSEARMAVKGQPAVLMDKIKAAPRKAVPKKKPAAKKSAAPRKKKVAPRKKKAVARRKAAPKRKSAAR
jgi:hypothetical protein